MERVSFDLGQDVIAATAEQAREHGPVRALLPVTPSPSRAWRKAFNRLAGWGEERPIAMIPPPSAPHGDKILVPLAGLDRKQVLARLETVTELMAKADAEADAPPDTTAADAVLVWWRQRQAER